MPLQQSDIDLFKQYYKEDFGEDLTDEEAWVMAARLLNLYRVLYDSHLKG